MHNYKLCLLLVTIYYYREAGVYVVGISAFLYLHLPQPMLQDLDSGNQITMVQRFFTFIVYIPECFFHCFYVILVKFGGIKCNNINHRHCLF